MPLYAALVFALVGALTLLEMQRGATLDSNRLLNIATWALKLAMAFAFLRFIPVLAPYSLLDVRSLPWLVQFAIFFVAMDFGEYLFHRAQHAIPWLWSLHSLHHSDPDMNATTTERHFWGDQFLKALTIYPAAALVISPVPSVWMAYLIVGLWNYVAHSALPLGFGRYSWAFQSPAYHRMHHSSLPEHYNSNFAALLPIWDVIAGSYRRPDGHPPTGLAIKPERLVDVITWPLTTAGMPQRAR